MGNGFEAFRLKFRDLVQELGTRELEDIEKNVWSEIETLCSEGIVALPEDYTLGGRWLEFRTKLLLRDMDLQPQDGRPVCEDIVVTPPPRFEIQIPLVFEVKSSAKPAIARRDLRQLDDWVFELSGEELARKKGLGSITLAMATGGMLGGHTYHPTRHKGVMIFNGPIGIPFNERQKECFGANEIEFARSHYLCLIPFNLLIKRSKLISQRKMRLEDFWNSVHECEGVLEA